MLIGTNGSFANTWPWKEHWTIKAMGHTPRYINIDGKNVAMLDSIICSFNFSFSWISSSFSSFFACSLFARPISSFFFFTTREIENSWLMPQTESKALVNSLSWRCLAIWSMSVLCFSWLRSHIQRAPRTCKSVGLSFFSFQISDFLVKVCTKIRLSTCNLGYQ